MVSYFFLDLVSLYHFLVVSLLVSTLTWSLRDCTAHHHKFVLCVPRHLPHRLFHSLTRSIFLSLARHSHFRFFLFVSWSTSDAIALTDPPLDVDVEGERGLVLAALVVGGDDRVDAGVRRAALHDVEPEPGERSTVAFNILIYFSKFHFVHFFNE